MNLEIREVYQIRFWLNKLSPLIWRRFLINPQCTTIADLHHLIQLAMHWEDFHLHEFTIQGKVYGISYEGGICFGDDPHKITLKDLQMQVKERLFYKYNFHIPWEDEIRLEKILPMNLKSIYPVCIGGNNIAPSEDYNSPIDFIEKQPSKFIDGMDSLIEDLITIKKKRGISIDIIRNKITEMADWINKNKFNRKNLNDKLKQYARGTVSLEDLIEEDDYDEEEVVLCE